MKRRFLTKRDKKLFIIAGILILFIMLIGIAVVKYSNENKEKEALEDNIKAETILEDESLEESKETINEAEVTPSKETVDTADEIETSDESSDKTEQEVETSYEKEENTSKKEADIKKENGSQKVTTKKVSPQKKTTSSKKDTKKTTDKSANKATTTSNKETAKKTTTDKVATVNRISASNKTANKANNKVTAPKITTEKQTRTESISFKTIDNYASSGGKSRVYQAGKNGVKTIVEKVTFKDGKEVDREVVSSDVTTKPVNKIIERYVMVKPEKVEYIEEETRVPIYVDKYWVWFKNLNTGERWQEWFDSYSEAADASVRTSSPEIFGTSYGGPEQKESGEFKAFVDTRKVVTPAEYAWRR